MRRRLVLLALAVTSLVALAFALPLALVVRDVAADRALTSAERDAAAVGLVLAVGADRGRVASAAASTGAGADDRLGVLLADGTWIGRRAPAGDPAVTLARREKRAFTAVDGSDRVVLQPVVADDGTAVVRVVVPAALLEEGVRSSWLALGALATGLVLAGVALADRLGARATRAVHSLAEAARRLGAGDLSTRVEPAGPPDVADASRAFNLLAGRVGELLDAERELVADLSHRLRTPLTALRLDAERVADADRRDALVADADALEAAVGALIEDARRPLRAGVSVETDLTAAVADRVEFWGALADEEGRPWSWETDGASLVVALPAADVDALVDVLVGNVFTHTPPGTGYAVQLRRDGDAAALVVDDAGPGLPGPEALERGVSGGASTGLGLDIARRTTTGCGGTLTFGRAPMGGARIRVALPLREAAAK